MTACDPADLGRISGIRMIQREDHSARGSTRRREAFRAAWSLLPPTISSHSLEGSCKGHWVRQGAAESYALHQRIAPDDSSYLLRDHRA